MPQFIYTMKGLGKVHLPDHVVLKDIWLSFLPGAKIGVLGLNGSGKSTLLRIMAGQETQFIGEAFPSDGISIGFLEQEPQLDPKKTVLGNVEEGVAEIKALLTRYDEINAMFGEELSPEQMDKVLEQGRVQDRIEAAEGWNLDSRLELAMDALRLPPADADVTTLSGGERRRVALCRLLLKSPDLLLLDEPTNHLDAESVAWLERFLKDYPGTVVAVTHDRYFLDNVAGWILELDRGHGIPWEGNYSSWLDATSSFWQGVDVRGEQLSCVIIDKLPFAVPSDPIVAARQRHIEEQGGSSFYEYSVPQAIISLKQGLGRLIRSTTDRGVLAVLDPRLRTKVYGQTFLQSLPPCRITSKIDDLARVFETYQAAAL